MVINQSSLTEAPNNLSMGGRVEEFKWSWKGQPMTIAYEVWGEGSPVLLLPAFSTISSRAEMYGLAEQLSEKFQVFMVDWVGFGESSHPAIEYRPALYHAFLRDFVRSMFSQPVVAIAAGHSAGFIMQLAHQDPCPWSYVILTAPTWRGPLPTMGDHRWFFKRIQQLIGLPIVGQFFYLLNTLPWFLRWMMGRHVYSDSKNITRSLVTAKWRTTQQRNARFASAAFVTGALDPIRTRQEFIDYFQPLPVPVLMVIGEQTPPKSREEMEFVVHFSGVQVYRMPGSLGLHEEYSRTLMSGILPFLTKVLS
ncbi:alpha/beta hydrolase [Leptolyngbyaceae cyanobacterium UHCC 1019]